MTTTKHSNYDVIVIGGGAAGLMCAIEAGNRGRSVLVIERSEKIGKKIIISGGGRCNFTNLNAAPHTYQCRNPHFHKSALSRYTQYDFLQLAEKHGIDYYEKKLGQQFCKETSRNIIALLEAECEAANVEIVCSCLVQSVAKSEQFQIGTTFGEFTSDSLVIATGGLSIPLMGATGFGYKIARQFGLDVLDRQAALVPFVFSNFYLQHFEGLSGISMDAIVRCNDVTFRENILVTHKGVSGPAILQISSYWHPGDTVAMDVLPDIDLADVIETKKQENNKQEVKTVIAEFLPKRFVDRVFELWLVNKPLKQLTANDIENIENFFHSWEIQPTDTEGYRTAEVTLGGVNTDEISSKTFETKKIPDLYFIGEVLDVTGWLGGYNLQWAWSSGYCAGQYV
jgi:hypothetical protein